jgi:diaminopimelate epimerase
MRRGLLANAVEIELAGGKLQIEWKEGDVVWMTGPTANVYEGRIDLSFYQQ